MSKLYLETINEPQLQALESLKEFSSLGILGGGTALALQLGHRKSVDLDFFIRKEISLHLVARIQKFYRDIKTLIRTGDEFTFLSPQGVKITFLFYPYKPFYQSIRTSFVPFFDWRDITLDKAHTIGRRQEWRDYVDLYYCVKQGISIQEIIKGSEKKFGESFSAKLFLGQLVYFQDIQEFSSVELIGRTLSAQTVKDFFEKEVAQIQLL